MGFKIKKNAYKSIPVLELHGRVSAGDTIKVSQKLEAYSKKSLDKVIVDLSKIDFIDSSWLGAFVYSWKIFNELNKELIFLIPPGNILDIFTYANLHMTFTIVDSLDKLA